MVELTQQFLHSFKNFIFASNGIHNLESRTFLPAIAFSMCRFCLNMFMALIIAIHILTSRPWHWLLHPWKAGLSMLVCMVVIVLTLEILILRHLHWD